MTVSGGLTVDRWIYYLDLKLSLLTTAYTAMSVASGYALSIESLFTTLFLQGALETWAAIGKNKKSALYIVCFFFLLCICSLFKMGLSSMMLI